MDDSDQACAYAQADFERPNTLFLEMFARHFPDFTQGRLLDLGCGPADIPLRFVNAYSGIELVVVDGAQAMIDLAEKAIEGAGAAARIQTVCWHVGEQTCPEIVGGPFDGVISNSFLHHLDDPSILWNTVIDQAKPGSPVLVMDLKRPHNVSAARAFVEEYSGNEPELLRQDFFRSLLAAYREQELREQLVEVGLGHLNVEQISDLHLAVYGRLLKR